MGHLGRGDSDFTVYQPHCGYICGKTCPGSLGHTGLWCAASPFYSPGAQKEVFWGQAGAYPDTDRYLQWAAGSIKGGSTKCLGLVLLVESGLGFTEATVVRIKM